MQQIKTFIIRSIIKVFPVRTMGFGCFLRKRQEQHYGFTAMPRNLRCFFYLILLCSEIISVELPIEGLVEEMTMVMRCLMTAGIPA